MSEKATQYDPTQHEAAIYQRWQEAGYFQPALGSAFKKKPFVIMMPLPNVTGNLHMGHALNGTMQDILIRYHRMLGEAVLWQPGTDHAGIATQNVVEKQLRKEGVSRHELGREKFIERVWQWKEEYGNTIVQQQQRLGLSCDWSRAVFTMDGAYVRAVHEAFVRYFNKGYIYRGNRIVNWCPRCQSVISDLEINHQKQTTTLYYLRYPLADGSGAITVATTRPETMLGDTAVAVHPADARYAGYRRGEEARGVDIVLPLTGRVVPLIFDERIDQAFGTGAVKVTPAHDVLDADLATTHGLPSINIIGEDGRLTAAAGKYAGLTTIEAREQVLAALREAGALEREEDYTHNVATCERCGTVTQPLISRQWFVAMESLKAATLAAVNSNAVHFHPPRWREHMLSWLDNVHDWTISRQLWWGQRIPVWWKPGVRGTEKENEPGAFVVSTEKPAGEEWEADPDVLDTWFSSAIWPLATLGWPDNTADLRTFYPTSVLITARDILYLWVARMIFSGLELMQGAAYDERNDTARLPFRDVLIHPTVLNKQGQRMSKSLGTGVDPTQLIDRYGADATRFGLMYQMTYDSQAIKFDEQSIVAARNFANKLWNIARLLHTLSDQPENISAADVWIEQRSGEVSSVVTRLLNEFQLGEAARVLHEFVWDDYADWYLEILKVQGSFKAAMRVFRTMLGLLHPFMPHITEVLWEQLGEQSMLMVSAWPVGHTPASDQTAAATVAAFQDIVRTVRSARVLLGVGPTAVLTLAVDSAPLPEVLAAVAKVSLASEASADMKRFPLPAGGSLALGGTEITPAAIARAQERLHQERDAARALADHLQATLAAMAGKAPAAREAAMRAEQEKATARLRDIEQSLQLLA